MDNEKNEELANKFADKIVFSTNSKQLLLSGPGTGKTYLFKRKINEKWTKEGINKDQILITSFINFIVDDIKKDIPDCKVYTLHKIAKIIIFSYLKNGNNFNNNINIKFNIAAGIDESILYEDTSILEKTNNPSINSKEVSKRISMYFQSPLRSPAPKYLGYYLKLTSFYNLITFSDSIVRAQQILRNSKEIFLDYKRLMVDEYQDFNDAEQKLIDELFRIIPSGIIAGDDDQSIYSIRSADPLEMITLYNSKEWEKCNLSLCRRCHSNAIIGGAQAICERQTHQNRFKKELIPLKDNGSKIKIVNLSYSKSSKNEEFLIEAEFIAKKIDKATLTKWDKDYPAYLILALNKNHLIRIAQVLQLKYQIDLGIKDEDIFECPEVQRLWSYLQLFYDNNCNIAYRRLLKLEAGNDEKIFKKAQLAGGFKKISQQYLPKVNTNLLKIISLLNQESTFTKDLIDKVISIIGIKNTNEVQKFTSILIKKNDIIGNADNLISELRSNNRIEAKKKKVQCLTVWGSKGLKAENVFILGLEEGYLPRNNNVVQDEEIRLMYVAMTRAVENLYLLTCKMRYDGVHEGHRGGRNGPKEPSIFINWIPSQYREHIFLKKSDFER